MPVDRAQIRRDAERSSHAPNASNTHLQREAILAHHCLALLAELEQSERLAQNDHEHLLSVVADRAGWRTRAEQAEARLAKVPALVEALGRIEGGAASNPGVALATEARAALAAWEDE